MIVNAGSDSKNQPFVVAIDGPAASGKGTLARKLSVALDLPHLDTGLTYRAVAKALLDGGHPLDDEALAAKIALKINLGALDRTALAQHHIGEAASKTAVMPKVRQALVEAQRKFAQTGAGAVLDGRDIGTVVCPDADVKLFVTASPGIRAGRRFEELVEAAGPDGPTSTYDEVLADLRKRDERDTGRKDSPLRPAKDAHLLDTTEMDIETAFREAMHLIDAKRNSGNT